MSSQNQTCASQNPTDLTPNGPPTNCDLSPRKIEAVADRSTTCNGGESLQTFAHLTGGGLTCARHLQDDLDRRTKALELKKQKPQGAVAQVIKETENTLRVS